MTYTSISFLNIRSNLLQNTARIYHHHPSSLSLCQNHYSKQFYGNSSLCRIQKLSSSRHSSSSSSSSTTTDLYSYLHFFSTILQRVILGISIYHLNSNYGIQFIKCEGPSMKPTIQSSGEIIIVERLTHLLFGFKGYDTTTNITNYNNDNDCNGDASSLGNLVSKNDLDKGIVRATIARTKQLQWEKTQEETNHHHLQSPTTTTTTQTISSWYEPILTNKTFSPQFQNLNTFAKFKFTCQNLQQKLSSGIQKGDVVVVQHPHKEGTVCKRVLGLPGDLVLRPKSSSSGSNTRRRMEDMIQKLEEMVMMSSSAPPPSSSSSPRDQNENDKSIHSLNSLLVRNYSKNKGFVNPMTATTNTSTSSDIQNLTTNQTPNTTNPDEIHNFDIEDDEYNDINSTLSSCNIITIPDGHIWIEGDNTTQSLDSREYGPIPASLIVGKVLYRFHPWYGSGVMLREGRPTPESLSSSSSSSSSLYYMPFTGSVVLPAGYEGEKLIKDKL